MGPTSCTRLMGRTLHQRQAGGLAGVQAPGFVKKSKALHLFA